VTVATLRGQGPVRTSFPVMVAMTPFLAQGGDDTIEGGAGTDCVVGSIAANSFVFALGMEIDIIFDSTDGTNLLDVSAFGFTNFATKVQPRHDSFVVTWAKVMLILYYEMRFCRVRSFCG